MVTVISLWLPILVAAVLVFVASSVIHMVLNYHMSDFAKLPNEDAVMDALRKFDIPPGDYVMPCPADSKDMRSPEFVAKTERGPVGFFTILLHGGWQMGSSLAQWFAYCLLVGIFAAYLTGRAIGPGAGHLEVFRFAGTVAFVGYGLALLQNSIWMKRSWSATGKSVFDGLVYGLLTAGTFGWLWPG